MNYLRLRRPLVILALAGALAVSYAAAQPQIPPSPHRWATDEAGFLSRQAAEALDARLENYERQTGHQFLVWIGRTLGENAVLEDWTVKTFEAWKVGRKGLDDGLVLFILAEDRKIRIEVGYGLEDKVPDIYAYRVINNILTPGIRAGRPDEAVDAAVTALIGYISGNEGAAGEEAPNAPRKISAVKGIFTGIIVLILIIIFITNPSLAFWLLINILSGGRGGGGGGWGGGGGGGFSGGGGRSGGGGASGSW